MPFSAQTSSFVTSRRLPDDSAQRPFIHFFSSPRLRGDFDGRWRAGRVEQTLVVEVCFGEAEERGRGGS